MLRGMLGSVKSENPKGKKKLGNGTKLKLNIELIRLGVIIFNLPF